MFPLASGHALFGLALEQHLADVAAALPSQYSKVCGGSVFVCVCVCACVRVCMGW